MNGFFKHTLGFLYQLIHNLCYHLFYETLNLDIHSSIWKAADNTRLYKFLSTLWNGPSIGFLNPKLDHYTKSTDEHIAILEVIKKQDAETAKKIMELHTERSMNNILDSLASTSQLT